MTVIIPVYNCEQFLRRCLDSIFQQTFQDFDVIAVNDGSTDSSLEVLREYESQYANLLVIDQANAGQGAARNRALDLATGEYILFVDSDDFIESVTLQVTVERAEQDQSDLVHFDWKLYSPSPNHAREFNYYNADPFWHKRTLEGIECDELFRVENFFSVSNLYRRSFLNHHEIRFEEGRIYEDNPFVVLAVNRAQCISMVHSPLYIVNPHPESTTRSNTDSDKHYRDHIHAIRRSFELLDRRNPRAAVYLTAYHVKKMGPYYERRIPRRYRSAYIREFVDIVHEAGVTLPPHSSANKPTRLSLKLQIFEKQRYMLFQTMIASKNVVMPRFKKARGRLRRLKHRRSKNGAWSQELEAALQQPVLAQTITFLGLDYRYTGNSRYLFEELIQDPKFSAYELKFATDDERVAHQYRLTPNQLETNSILARSEIVIAESWIPPHVRKHRDSTWVQLWHGTPIKQMLFDSHEPRIIWNRRKHKISKYRDIQNWDYLLVDSAAAADKFETAFLFPKERMIYGGYPRVRFLLEHREDEALKRRLRDQAGLASDDESKIVLYVPTWRDVNYGRGLESSDYDYVLDVNALAEELGDDYKILFHDHGYLASKLGTDEPRSLDVSRMETQELLLIADVVVSDYSSVIFDALAIGTPVVLYAPDIDQFEEHRGLYSDIWTELSGFTVDRQEEVVSRIRGTADPVEIDRVSNKFGYSTSESLSDLVDRLVCVDQQSIVAAE